MNKLIISSTERIIGVLAFLLSGGCNAGTIFHANFKHFFDNPRLNDMTSIWQKKSRIQCLQLFRMLAMHAILFYMGETNFAGNEGKKPTISLSTGLITLLRWKLAHIQ